jgi:hypothetical protein
MINVEEVEGKSTNPILGKPFAELSANLINFFNIPDMKEWVSIYLTSIGLVKSLANDDADIIIDKIKAIVTKYEKELVCKLVESKIVYSFHIGEYRITPMILLALGFDVKLLVAEHIRNEQLQLYYQTTELINHKFGTRSKLTVLTKLKSSNDDNEKIFIYFDGNIGSGKYHSDSKNFHSTDFLGQRVFFHQGLSFISYFHKQPVLCMYVLPENETYVVEAIQHIETAGISKGNIRDYCQTVSAIFSSTLSESIKRNFTLWENAFAMHTWIQGNNVSSTNFNEGEKLFFENTNRSKTTFNVFRYFPIKVNSGEYMFDRKTYLVHKIRDDEYVRYYKEVSLFFFGNSKQ